MIAIDRNKRSRGAHPTPVPKSSTTSLSLVFASMADAAIATDASGRVTLMNAAAERLTGLSSTVALGRQHDAVFALRDADTKEPMVSPIEAALAGGGEVPVDERSVLASSDGDERFIEGRAAAIHDGKGIAGAVLTFRDVTSRRLEEREAARRSAEACEALRLQQEFVNILGHDLRVPLGSIVLSAQRLRSGDPRIAIEAAKRILHNGDRMERMVQQLLDFTRLRSEARLAIRPACVNLGSHFRGLLDDIQRNHERRSVMVEVDGDLDGEWDADRLGQVISNLVGNALQHGEETSAVMVRLDGSAAEHVVLSVLNLGEVPSTVLPILFDPFARLRTPRKRTQGLGLGLYISREIVHHHGGTLEVESGDGKTEMTVRLPRRCAAVLPHV